jgi:hypothetical protein
MNNNHETGLWFRIDHQELSEHCMSRALHHKEQAAKKQEQIPELQKALDIITGKSSGDFQDANVTVSNLSKGNYRLDPAEPIRDLESDIADHNRKVAMFEWMAHHVFDEVYRLRRDDLALLEIVRR